MNRSYVITLSVAAVLLGGSAVAIFANDSGTDEGASSMMPLKGPMIAPAENEPTISQLDASHGEEWHRVSLRLSGSMCPACLMELQDKFRHIAGIGFAKIELMPSAPSTPVTPKTEPKTVSAVIIYNNHEISWDKLKHVAHANKYNCVDVADQALVALPVQK